MSLQYHRMNRHPLVLARFVALLLLVAVGVAASAADRVLYNKKSQFNQIIVTEDDQGYRTLRFEEGGARQTVGKPGDPDYLGFGYTPVAFSALALADNPQRFLVVGVGGGTMPSFLRHHYPQATIDAVDIDPDVIHVAKEFFGLREDERMHTHAVDGRRFIETTREPYDVIFLDAFGTRNVPPTLTTIEFLNAVKRAVKPGGVVIGNIWSQLSNPLYDSMVRTYQEVFEDLYILDVAGTSNRILLALPRKVSLTREEYSRRARSLGTALKFPFDAGDVLKAGFLHATRKSSEGRVLRDAEIAPRS
jgi:spermidine synthase